ncbi:oligopeptide/dipeptide ABC transporter ATP-binding protein, partial [Staphylococcus pseudintermedius]|uniref:oligopeptide/dipeptide ABC transporter ATP-binding protein n=1 Tax=Staphylococcus pseudintermedius TaxID=283734 RepID=UPI000D902DDA
ETLETIKGSVPSLVHLPQQGCRFVNRCPHAMAMCQTQDVSGIQVADAHHVFCHLYTQDTALKEANES